MAVLSLFSIFFVSVSHVVAQQDKIVEILSVLTSRSGTTQMPYYQPTNIAEMSTQILPDDHQSGVNSYSTSLPSPCLLLITCIVMKLFKTLLGLIHPLLW